MELINLQEKYRNEKHDDNRRSYSESIIEEEEYENIIKSSDKNLDINSSFNSELNDNKKSFSLNSDYDVTIKEKPFLKLPMQFLNFYKRNENRCYFKLIIIIFILLISFFFSAQFIYVGKFAKFNKNDSKINIWEKLSLKEVIINPQLNFIYVIDIDLVVFMVHLIFFIIYSKGYKSADIYDFFNNNFWSFFLKCYYSFIIISTPIILDIIYQSETVIEFDLSNLILFSFISLFIILLVVILFYSMFEIPLKKIFKSFLVKEEILSDNTDDDNNSDDYIS
jgi:hypothetical protein